MLPAFFLQFIDLFPPGHGSAARTGIEFAVGLLLQFAVGEGGHGFILVLDQGAGGLGMIVRSAPGVIVQQEAVVRITQFPVHVIPDDDLGIGLAGKMIPEPFGIDAFRGQLALDWLFRPGTVRSGHRMYRFHRPCWFPDGWELHGSGCRC